MLRQFSLVGFGFWILALVFGLGSDQRIFAQTNTSQTPANRWLLIVETSSSMKNRAEAVQQIVASLLWSGMNGQMRPGDTVGLWTFNKELYAGRFPVQEWTPGKRQNIAAGVYEFLKAQKYEKTGRFDAFFPGMEQLIKGSEFITVVLISDGRERIRYTPFDDQINIVYTSWQKKQEKAHIPFVTALRAQQGQLTNYAVAMPPFPLELPPLPPELTKPAEIKIAQKPPTQASPPPLIVVGKKSEPAPTVQPAQPTGSNALPSALSTSNGTIVHEPAPSLAAATPVLPAEPSTLVADKSNLETPVQAATAAPGKIADVPAGSKSHVTTVAAREANAPFPIQTAQAEPPGKLWSRTGSVVVLGIAGLILTSLVAAVTVVRMRRARTPLRVSLITRSLDSDKGS